MAVVTFAPGEDPVATARAVMSALSLWLSEQPRPEQAPPARAHCIYYDEGKLRTLTVVVAEGD